MNGPNLVPVPDRRVGRPGRGLAGPGPEGAGGRARLLLAAALALPLLAGCSGEEQAEGGRCGNGTVESGEICDDGAGNSNRLPGACRTDCRPARCGDGVTDPGEACDGGPGCDAACGLLCGNGIVDEGEGCDDGAANDDLLPGACRTTCVPAGCGDGVLDPGEDCDDGEANRAGTPDACRPSCLLPRCGDGVVDPGAGESCDDANADAEDGCAGCALVPPGCGSRTVVDLAGGVPWSGDELVYEGTVPDQSFTELTCDTYVPGGGVPDAVHVLVLPGAGDLVVEVTGQGAFRPSVELRDTSCSARRQLCSRASAAGETAVVVERGVTADRPFRWIVVESAEGPAGTGEGAAYRLTARFVPPLAAGAPCVEQGLAGSCGPGLVCADPDGDGAGRCATLVPEGSACDPAGQESLCVESACVGGTCASTCGDGTLQPWEECDDGNVAAGDNCSPACLAAGRSCAEPFRIDRAPANGGYEWAGDTNRGSPSYTASCGITGDHPDLVGVFTAPEAGRWGFRLSSEPAWNEVLSLVTGSCGSIEELACAVADSRSGSPTLVVPLAAGETVWPVIDGTGDGAFYRSGPFTLRVERVVCGDGIVGIGEACDDGNSSPGDGCSAACEVEEAGGE